MQSFSEFLTENNKIEIVSKDQKAKFVQPTPEIHELARRNRYRDGFDGIISISNSNLLYLYKLNDVDKRMFRKLLAKPGLDIYRYISRTTAAGGMMPLIAISRRTGMMYNMVDDEQDDEVSFETKGTRVRKITIFE